MELAERRKRRIKDDVKDNMEFGGAPGEDEKGGETVDSWL